MHIGSVFRKNRTEMCGPVLWYAKVLPLKFYRIISHTPSEPTYTTSNGTLAIFERFCNAALTFRAGQPINGTSMWKAIEGKRLKNVWCLQKILYRSGSQRVLEIPLTREWQKNMDQYEATQVDACEHSQCCLRQGRCIS